ncbi:MAG: leucyl aminopeptidase [bacterium]
MEFSAKTADAVGLTSDCLVVGVHQASKKSGKVELTPTAARIDRACDGRIGALLRRGAHDGALGVAQMLYDLPGVKAGGVLLLGLGRKAEFNARSARRAAYAAAKSLERCGVRAVGVCLLEVEYADADARRRARNIAEAMFDALYRFDQTKSSRAPAAKLKRATMLCARAQLAAVRRGLREGGAIARGVKLARDYANLPGNLCTPSFLAKEARRLGARLGLKTTVLGEAEMKRRKMGALLSVSRGSCEPAKLIVMEYRGGRRTARPVVLVGKGLTFDAGGISLKPAAAMDEMKYDMCGGASVFGALQAAAELRLKINLIGIVPSSENLPDGAANKPGDIVTSMSGTTIEILNTDAEGRLILCDALTYAERFKPAAVVDIATLTGACMVALGQCASGLFSDCDALAEALLAAGEASCDRAWRMPVWDEYDPQLRSNFADLANIGGRYAGAVTAACFLKRFAAKYDWAHLDIAGTAWTSGADKGATGRPVPLLVEFLLNR